MFCDIFANTLHTHASLMTPKVESSVKCLDRTDTQFWHTELCVKNVEMLYKEKEGEGVTSYF